MSCNRVGECPPGAMSCASCVWFGPDRAPTDPADVKTLIRSTLAKARDGLTSEALAHAAGLNENTVRGRLSELERAGVVRRRAKRHRTATGTKAHLYVLAFVPALVAGGTLEGSQP